MMDGPAMSANEAIGQSAGVTDIVAEYDDVAVLGGSGHRRRIGRSLGALDGHVERSR
jgi:hypothetical protein